VEFSVFDPRFRIVRVVLKFHSAPDVAEMSLDDLPVLEILLETEMDWSVRGGNHRGKCTGKDKRADKGKRMFHVEPQIR